MASSFWTFSRQALVPRLFRDHSPSLGRGQAGAHRTQLPDELLTSKSWFILLICATTAHFHRIDVDLVETIAVLVARIFAAAVTDGLVLVASVLHGCAGWRKGRPVSMLRISPSCRTNTMLTVATTFRGRSDV